FELREKDSSAPTTLPVAVAVGHRSTLVAAGLAAMLARTPGCDIHLSQIGPHECTSERLHKAQLIFGDSVLLKCLREQAADSRPGRPSARAKFVWVTTGDETVAHAAKAAGEIDEHLPLECLEQELFAVVRRLAGFDGSYSWHRTDA